MNSSRGDWGHSELFSAPRSGSRSRCQAGPQGGHCPARPTLGGGCPDRPVHTRSPGSEPPSKGPCSPPPRMALPRVCPRHEAGATGRRHLRPGRRQRRGWGDSRREQSPPSSGPYSAECQPDSDSPRTKRRRCLYAGPWGVRTGDPARPKPGRARRSKASGVPRAHARSRGRRAWVLGLGTGPGRSQVRRLGACLGEARGPDT